MMFLHVASETAIAGTSPSRDEAGQLSFHHVLTFHGSSTNTSTRVRRSLAVHLVDGAVRSVSHLDGWQHYNLGLLQQRGGEVGDPYDIDELWPVVFPAHG